MQLYVLYLIWKYSTLTLLTLLLMRKNLTGAWSKVGASKNHSVLSQNSASCTYSSHFVVSHTVKKLKNSYLFTFLVGIYVRVLSKVGHATLQTFKYRQCKQIFFFKKLFILKVLNVLGLKNSIELKETMQYYTNLPIFEHFGC